MNIKQIALSCLLFSCLHAYAESVALGGTAIGSPSIDYATESVSQTANLPANAFDGDLSTFYASYADQYAWVGLDLGRKCVIDRVGYAPSASPSGVMQLGVFEGANEADFSDAIPFHIIKEAPTEGQMSTCEVDCSRGFRYVRYVGPSESHCNVAELEFYGQEGEGDDSRLYQMTNLPLLVIHTGDEAEVTSRETYLDGWLSIVSDGGSGFFTDSLKIRGRGGGSWDVSNSIPYGGKVWRKLPYRLKLAHKARLLDMSAKDKDWVLINNLGDKTLMRNWVAFEASRRMGMEYTPAGRLVDVMYNGELKGTYQLCDKIEVGKNRINITKMEPTDNQEPEVTGGYLIEIDASQGRESSDVVFMAPHWIPVTIQEPDDDELTEQQYNYISGLFGEMVEKVFGTDAALPESGYPSMLDVDSFLRHFLVGEFSGNTDTYWSTWMSKDRGADEKFKCCTVWDFDIAFENDKRTYPINSLDSYLCLSTKSSVAGGMRNFVQRVVNTQTNRIKELWSEARDTRGLTEEVMSDYIDSVAEVLRCSQEYNFLRWPILDVCVHQNFQALGSFDKEVEFLKKFVSDRFAWMDKKIGYKPNTFIMLASADNDDGEICSDDQGIRIEGFGSGCTYRIYSIGGQCLAQGKTNPAGIRVGVSRGMYVVTVGNAQGLLRQQKLSVGTP